MNETESSCGVGGRAVWKECVAGPRGRSTGKCLVFISSIILIACPLCNGELQEWNKRNLAEVNARAQVHSVMQCQKLEGGQPAEETDCVLWTGNRPPGEIWPGLVCWQKATHEAGDQNKDLDAQVEGSLTVTPW